MRTRNWSAVGAMALLAGCNGQGLDVLSPSSNPGPSHSAGAVMLSPSGSTAGAPIVKGDQGQSAMALFTVEVDLDSKSATVTPKVSDRSGQASDNGYELSIEPFINASTFVVDSIEVNPTTVDILYTVTHPMSAPTDLGAQPTAANRADLGAVIRTLFLLDVDDRAANTYFAGDGDVVANTDLVANADGFYTPAGLVTLGPDAIANTFPYQLVVDEAANGGLGNRVGIPGDSANFGEGNYTPSLGGWQADNMGAGLNGWTGYGMLHQGQSATRTIRIHRAPLNSGSRLTFDTALIAKYTDPRGGATSLERRKNRLPSGDPAAFAYRMPYGALDVEQVRFTGETGGFVPDQVSSTTVGLSVRDFDARAMETTATDLAMDPNVGFVQRNGSGAPLISLDIPSLLTTPVTFESTDLVDDDTTIGGDAGVDSGQAGDELYFQKQIDKAAGSGQLPGSAKGLVRVTDVEDTDAERGAYFVALTEELQPLPPGLFPRPRTYQAMSFLLANPNGQPFASASLAGGITSILSGETLTAQADSYVDLENDPGTFTVDFDFDGEFFTDSDPVAVNTADPFPVALATSDPIVNNQSAAPVAATAVVRYRDASHVDQSITIPYTLGGNEAPTADIAMAAGSIVVNSYASIVISNEFDAEGNPVTYDIDWDWDGIEANFSPDMPFVNLPALFAQFPRQVPSTPMVLTLGVRVKDTLHPAGTITGVTYNVVPPNQQATAVFITPPTVLSGTSTTVTADRYDDPDGDASSIMIDWNGDADYNDVGETGLPPLTFQGQIYTSPVMLNNLTATPRPAATINIQYSDQIAPHLPVNTTAGSYVLGGNRPPEVTGDPSVQVTPLPSAAIFRILKNTSNATDPEGNAITYTLRGVPDSGAATNKTSGAFPIDSNPYMNPPATFVNFTVYANDALHATTAGTAYPTILRGDLCGVYVFNHNFDLSSDGWLAGFNGLPNTDAVGWSQFSHCTSEGAPGLSGNVWTTGPDTGQACDYRRNDYGDNLDNNVVSPSFSTVGLTKANLVFNSLKNGRINTCRYRIHVSTNGGVNWTQIYDTTRTGAISGTLTESNVTVNLNAYINQPDVRLRFQMRDTTIDSFGADPYAGWMFDNVRVTGCP